MSRSSGAERPSVLLATCAARPELTPSDAILARELGERGLSVEARPWDLIDPVDPAGSIVCLRSTWDYHRRFEEFARWVRLFSQDLWNPPATVLWNTDKIYLRELQSAGIPLPETSWLAAGERPDLPALLQDRGWGRAVVKPRVSATAYGLSLISLERDSALPAWGPLDVAGGLVQEFVPEIVSAGEISLVFIAGEFSHGVIKKPAEREFRVQDEFGGSVHPLKPRQELADFGHRVLDACSSSWVYARVDLVETSKGLMLMEIELVEPELFFTLFPAGAARLAEALAAKEGEKQACGPVTRGPIEV